MATTATCTIELETSLEIGVRPEPHHQEPSAVAPDALAGREATSETTRTDDARSMTIESGRLAGVRFDAERRLQSVRTRGFSGGMM
jgi:hypothetical protein